MREDDISKYVRSMDERELLTSFEAWCRLSGMGHITNEQWLEAMMWVRILRQEVWLAIQARKEVG